MGGDFDKSNNSSQDEEDELLDASTASRLSSMAADDLADGLTNANIDIDTYDSEVEITIDMNDDGFGD